MVILEDQPSQLSSQWTDCTPMVAGYPECPVPLPLEPPSRSQHILCWFTESAEAVAESLLSPTESVPRGATIATAAPALSSAALPAACRRGGAQLRPGQQLRPLLRAHASLQRPPAHLAHWGVQVTFCSPSEAGCQGEAGRTRHPEQPQSKCCICSQNKLAFSTMPSLPIYTKCVLCVVRD